MEVVFFADVLFVFCFEPGEVQAVRKAENKNAVVMFLTGLS